MRNPPGHSCVAALAAVALIALGGCRTEPRPHPTDDTVPSTPAPAAAPAHAGPEAAAPIQHDTGTVPAAPKPRVADAGARPAPAPAPVIARLTSAEKSRKVEGVIAVDFVGKHGLVAISGERGVDVVDPATGTGFSIVTGARVGTTRVSADASLAAVADASGRVTLWDLRASSLRRTWPGAAEEMAFSADGKRLAASAEAVVVWDTATGAEVRRVESSAFGLAFTAGDREIVFTSNNVGVYAYDLASGAKVAEGGAPTGGTFGIAVSPDGRFGAAGAPDGHGLQVFDVRVQGNRQLVTVNSCQEHVGPAFSSDSRLVFAHGGGHWVKAFETGTWKPYASYHARPEHRVAGVADDLSRVVVVQENTKPRVVTVETNAEVGLDRAFEGEASYSLSGDGLTVAAVSNRTARVWSAKTGAVLYEAHP